MDDHSPDVDSVAPASTSVSTTETQLSAVRFWGIVITGTLLAGLLAFALGEFTHSAFVAPKVMSTGGSGTPVLAPTFEGLALADTKNSLLTYVGVALIFGLISGIVGGITIGSLRSALFSGVVGAIIGGSVTGLVIKGAMFLYIREKQLVSSDPELNLFVPFLLHASFGMAVGLASAFALALGVRARGKRFGSILANGLVGGMIGATFFELVGGHLFPLSRTDRPIAEYWAARLIGIIAVALLGTCLAAAAVRAKAKT